MRKLLLGTSALIGATALIASAQAAAPELTISGSLDFHLAGGEYQVRSSDGRISANAVDIGVDEDGWRFGNTGFLSEIRFLAKGESDGGTTYGARIDYRYLANSTDEAYIYVAGDWGRVHLGQDDGAIAQHHYYAGYIAPAPYGIDGFLTYLNGIQGPWDSVDANKITYFSPNFNGFGFAASLYEGVGTIGDNRFGNFRPGPIIGTNGTGAGPATLAFSEIIELAARFDGSAGDFNYGVVLSFQSGDISDRVKDISTGQYDDLSLWAIGAKFDFGPITAAASYSDAGDSGVLDSAPTGTAANANGLFNQLVEGHKYYDIGVAYDISSGMAVGISYGEETFSRLAPAGTAFLPQETTNELIAIDFSFPILEGMAGYAGVAFSEAATSTATRTIATDTNISGVGNVATVGPGTYTTAAGTDVDATTYIVGTTVSF